MAYNIYNGNTKKPSSLGSELFIDPGFEDWSDSSTLTNWTIGNAGGSVGGSLSQESTEVRTGSYSVKFVNDSNGYGKYISQTITGLTEGSKYSVSVYAKGSGEISMFFLDDNIDLSPTKVYNFVDNQWEDFTGPENLGPNYFISATLGNDWEVFNDPNSIPAPANGTITPHIFVNGTDVTAYVDDASIKQEVSSEPKILWSFINNSDSANYVDDEDSVLVFRTIGGNPKNWLTLDTITGWSSEVSDNIVPLTQTTGIKYLGSATIDLKTIGATKILDAIDKYYYITNIIVETISSDNLVGDAIITIGNNPTDYDNILPLNFSYSASANQLKSVDLSNGYGKGESNSDVYVNVNSVDSGNAGTIKVRLFGILLDEEYGFILG